MLPRIFTIWRCTLNVLVAFIGFMYTIHASKAEIIFSCKFCALCRGFCFDFHNGCLSLQSGQGNNLLSGMIFLGGTEGLGKMGVVADPVAARDLLLVLDLASSFFNLLAPRAFIRLWASAFRLSQWLKSISVGRSMSELTVCMDHCSRRFGGSIQTACLRKMHLDVGVARQLVEVSTQNYLWLAKFGF